MRGDAVWEWVLIQKSQRRGSKPGKVNSNPPVAWGVATGGAEVRRYFGCNETRRGGIS